MATANGSTVEIKTSDFDQLAITAKKDENKESTTLIWFDPSIGSHHDTQQTKQQLRSINNFVIFHTNLDECVTMIRSINKEKIFLITSGSKASQLLPHVAQLRQLDSIFIFCIKRDKYLNLLDEQPKIIDIYTDLSELCAAIRQEIGFFNEQLQTFSVFDQRKKSTKDLSKQSAEFLWFHLFHHIILDLPRNQRAKKQMIEVCRSYYRGNTKELRLIDEFEQNYRPDDAIRWYSKQSFIYRLVNKALRSEDLHQLRTFRFFIGDLSQQLAEEHEKVLTSKETHVTLYRGAKLDREEFDKLRENLGKVIFTNGYLSTSRLEQAARTFATKSSKRRDAVGVLFQIHCDVQKVGRTVVFADIASLSEYPEERERFSLL
jgi:hypothetical protein